MVLVLTIMLLCYVYVSMVLSCGLMSFGGSVAVGNGVGVVGVGIGCLRVVGWLC